MIATKANTCSYVSFLSVKYIYWSQSLRVFVDILCGTRKSAVVFVTLSGSSSSHTRIFYSRQCKLTNNYLQSSTTALNLYIFICIENIILFKMILQFVFLIMSEYSLFMYIYMVSMRLKRVIALLIIYF